MRVLQLVIELILLSFMVALVFMEADVRIVIEVSTIYLAMVIKGAVRTKDEQTD